MPDHESAEPSLRAENAELRARLEEAEDMLRAIRGGGVDALVVEGDAGPQLFTLQGLDAEQNRLRGEMLAQVSDAVIAVDTEDRVSFFNAAAERQYGVRASDALGRQRSEVFAQSWQSPDAEAAMRTALRGRGEWRGELIQTTRDGRELHVECVVSALRGADGAGTGYVAAIRDVSERKQAEAALRRNAALFSTLIEQAPGGVYVVDAQFRVAQMNAETLPYFAAVQPLIGHDFDEALEIVWGPEVGPQIASIFRHTLATGERYVSPRFSELRHDIGVAQAFEWETQRITLPDGQHGVVCYFQDVTAQEGAATALRIANERLTLAVTCSQVVLFQQDLELRYTWLQNPAPGFEGSDAIGKRDADMMERAEDAAVVEALKREVIRSGVGQQAEVLVHLQGVARHYDLLVEPQRDAAGLISGVTCAAIDITERHQAEAARRESERFLQRVTQVTPGVIAVSDIERGRSLFVSRSVASVIGYSPEQIAAMGSAVETLMHPDDQPRFAQHLERVRALDDDEAADFEHRMRTKSGDWRWFHSRDAVFARDDAGNVTQFVSAAFDVTARKLAEAALADRTALLNGVLEGTTDLIFVKDLNGRLLLANAAFAAAARSTPEQLVGKTDEDWFPPDVAAAMRQQDQAVIAGGSPMQFEDTAPVAGEARSFLTLKAPLRDGSGHVVGILGSGRDITERKRAEAAMRRLAAIVESSYDALFGEDLDGIITSWNPGAEQIFGYCADEIVGTSILRLIPETRQDEERALQRKLAAGEHGGTFVGIRRTKDGREFHASITVAPLKDEAGTVIGTSRVVRDVTQRIRAEEALRDHAAVLADLDRRKNAFLATLAHELRNPLGVILGAVHLLRLTSQDRAAVEKGCARMERQVAVLIRLIDDLMDVSRINEDKLTLRTERLDLATVVHSALETSRGGIDQRGHTVTVMLPPQPIEVDGDATRLAQVVSNLLTNAAKYSDPGRPIVLTVEQQGDAAAVAVRDAGIGIASADLRRVFELFAQVGGAAHLAQGGLGIGLHLVKRVVELHGGSVEARSDGPGQGSEFLVRLPLASSGARPERPADGDVLSPPPSRRYRILVADDNEDAVTTLALLLRHLGHDVRTAENGAQAVAVATTFQPEVAVLDIGMPELDGHEACRLIRAQPGGDTMVLIAVSGWGRDEDKQRARDAGFQHHLVKPVDPAALTALLHASAPS